MRSSLILLFLLSCLTASYSQNLSPKSEFTKADTLRGMLSPLRTCYDVTYYHLDIAVDIEEKQISGSNLIRFIATTDFNRLQIDLFDNYLIESIMYKGDTLTYNTANDAIFIDFPKTVKKGTSAEFIVYYSGAPLLAKNAPWDGGFVFSKDGDGKPWVGVACQGLGASSWWPTKDHQSDEPDSMLISVSVPSYLKNISNGRLRSIVQKPNGYAQYNWFVSHPINNYNVTLNIGNYAHFNDVYQGIEGPLSLDYYVLPENIDKAKPHFQTEVKPMLKSFEHWFGAYPFYRDGYKLVETPYLGMEHQSAIAYGNKYQKGYLGGDLSGTGTGMFWDYIIVHETGHEWFGNNITSTDIADMWIHEAFTNYSEALFIETMRGKAAGTVYLNGLRKNILNDKPIIGPYNVNKEGSGDMYFKGSNVLHTVRNIINDDEKWLNILRGLNKQFGLKTTNTKEVVTYISEQSGKNLSSVFNQYLHHPAIPVLELKKGKKNYAYRWRADAANFNMPVRVKIDGAKEWAVLEGTTEWQSVQAGKISVDTENFLVGVRFSGE